MTNKSSSTTLQHDTTPPSASSSHHCKTPSKPTPRPARPRARPAKQLTLTTKQAPDQVQVQVQVLSRPITHPTGIKIDRSPAGTRGNNNNSNHGAPCLQRRAHDHQVIRDELRASRDAVVEHRALQGPAGAHHGHSALVPDADAADGRAGARPRRGGK